MAIITLPTITKGEEATVTLNKTELLALSANSYYQDAANLREVRVLLRSTVNDQKVLLKFTDLDPATPSTTFTLDANADDVFEVQSVKIIDKQGGIDTTPRADLTTADFDVDLSPAPVADTLDTNETDIALEGLNPTTNTSGTLNVWMKALQLNSSFNVILGALLNSNNNINFAGLTSPDGVNATPTLQFNQNGTSQESFTGSSILVNDIVDGEYHLYSLTWDTSTREHVLYMDSVEILRGTAVQNFTFADEGIDLISPIVDNLADDIYNADVLYKQISYYEGKVFNQTEIDQYYASGTLVDPSSLGIANLRSYYEFDLSNGNTVNSINDLQGNFDLNVVDGGTGASTNASFITDTFTNTPL